MKDTPQTHPVEGMPLLKIDWQFDPISRNGVRTGDPIEQKL